MVARRRPFDIVASGTSRLLFAAMLLAGCHSSTDAGFQPLPAASAVAKVKNLLVGLPPTEAEIAAVGTDPTALRGLVTQWVATPQYTAKMQDFFATAFQQSQAQRSDYPYWLPQEIIPNTRESFARTVIELIAEGRPFTDVFTTQRFMLTPALMSLYAVLDEENIDDADVAVDTIVQADPGFQFTLEASKGPIALSETLDPASPNYMVWYDPTLTMAPDPGCPEDPIVYATSANSPSIILGLYGFLNGNPLQYAIPSSASPQGFVFCSPGVLGSGNAYLTDSDYDTWTMMTIRQPMPGEATTTFYDLPALRSATELVLNTPRIGYFTTPSFLAQWQTNASNQARVTLNQTVITGLGKEINPKNVSRPPSLAAVDTTHAAPGSVCFSCHESLDPMRQFFRHDYSLFFSPQTDPTQLGLQPSFGFLGVSMPGETISDLATLLSTHPRVAAAWTQKLCTWANSAPCLETDPEFIRISAAFSSSGFNWNTLVVELMSSPIVSFLSDTPTADQNGELSPIARRDHLCATLSNRLGVNDICGLHSVRIPIGLVGVQTIASSLPADEYGRGNEVPILANAPSLMYRSGLENVCALIANQIVDNGASRYSSAQPGAAILDFVHNLMGVPAAQDATPLSILRDHFTSGVSEGSSPTTALRSTFVVACLSPSVAGLGQ